LNLQPSSGTHSTNQKLVPKFQLKQVQFPLKSGLSNGLLRVLISAGCLSPVPGIYSEHNSRCTVASFTACGCSSGLSPVGKCRTDSTSKSRSRTLGEWACQPRSALQSLAWKAFAKRASLAVPRPVEISGCDANLDIISQPRA
jgi:hypothetical protein